MKTTDNTINLDFKKVEEILKSCGWSYEHCGDRIKDGDMNEYINELEDALQEAHFANVIEDCITEADIEDALQLLDNDKVDSIEHAIARIIGDRIAQQYVDCVYPTVTFIACV